MMYTKACASITMANPTGSRPSPGRFHSFKLRQALVDALAGDEQFLDRVDRDLKVRLGLVRQLDLDDLLDAVRADHDGHADVQIVDAIFTRQVDGRRQDAL